MPKRAREILIDDALPENSANTDFLYNTSNGVLYYRNRDDVEWVAVTENVSSAITTHNTDTTNVHGIADTSVLATQSYVNTTASAAASSAAAAAVANLIDSAPDTLNTLNELAAAINDDAAFSSTLAASLANKLDSSTAASTYLTQSNAASTYLTQSNAASTYLTQANASSTYIPKTSASGTINLSGANVQLKSSPNTVSATTYVLVEADSYQTIVTTSASTVTITVPPESSVNFPIGTSISVLQSGAGQAVFAPGSGVTINTVGNSGALKNRYQYSICGLYKYSSDTWVAVGDLVV